MDWPLFGGWAGGRAPPTAAGRRLPGRVGSGRGGGGGAAAAARRRRGGGEATSGPAPGGVEGWRCSRPHEKK